MNNFLASLTGFLPPMLSDNQDLDDFVEGLKGLFNGYIIPTILAVVAGIGGIFVIVLGIKLLNADTAEKKDAIKKQFLTLIIAVGVIFFASVIWTVVVSVFRETAGNM